MQPDCPEMVSIIQKRKFKISTTAANNVINKDDGDAYNSSYIRKKIGEFERNYNEDIPPVHKPSGWLWKRVSGQVEAKSLEWIRCGEFSNMEEFIAKKNPGLVEQLPQ